MNVVQKRLFCLFSVCIISLAACHRPGAASAISASVINQTSDNSSILTRQQALTLPPKAEPELKLSDEQWRTRLSAEQYKVLREEGTEDAWSGEYLNHQEEGVYHCAGCGNALFSSATKYDSKTGWPSFWSPLDEDSVGTQIDERLRKPRFEVHCAKCGGHLGHVFQDGPEPTGLRYCINSISLEFRAHDGPPPGPQEAPQHSE